MRLMSLSLLVFTLASPLAPQTATEVEADALCVRNESQRAHLFAVDAPGAGRLLQELAPGERLCATGATVGATGVVSVFEDFDALEGCSRLVPVGQSESMRRYVDFDRCFWQSNSDQ